MKHIICKEFVHIYKFKFIQFLFFIFWLVGAILFIFHNKLKEKNHSKIHLYEKVILGQNDM
jgi:hypothetical protein